MLRRVVASTSVAPMMAAAASQKRFDHDRWYGHVLEMDVWNYKHTNTRPKWMRADEQSTEEAEATKRALPYIDFASSYEALIFDADRLNPHLNRKEFGNEVKARLEKQANIVSRSQHLIREGTYAKNEKLEDRAIARIADEESINADMKYVKCIRANEMAEDNRLDILPGGSPNSLREKTRWNLNAELHPADRAEIMTRLLAWLPEKYHIVYFDDPQTVAANDSSCRKSMLDIVDAVAKESAAEAEASGYKADLDEVIAELQDTVDPTRAITLDAIKKTSDLDQLEAWSRQIHEYNGDDRILAIYERAAEITKNEKHAALVKQLRQWKPRTKSYAN